MASINNNGGSGGDRKRAASGAGLIAGEDSEHSSSASDPDTIGLNVGGSRTFYANKSTLIAGSSYFAVRFNGPFNAGRSRRDANGFQVYFLEADPNLFEHVLNFLWRGVATWPSEEEDPILYKRLIAEAEFFGIESMMAKLRPPVYLFKPNDSGKGIMYWLGTTKGKQEYQNPFDIREVVYGGTCLANVEDQLDDTSWISSQRAEYRHNRRNFVQYRPQCGDRESDFAYPWFTCRCFLLNCEDAYRERFLTLTMKSVAINPTHYSLRYSDCRGCSDWDFQGSTDGKSWVTLHQARDDQSIVSPKGPRLDIIVQEFEDRCKGKSMESDKQSIATDVVEEYLREIWRVTATDSFFKQFRLVGRKGEIACLHGCGFEVYGRVMERNCCKDHEEIEVKLD